MGYLFDDVDGAWLSREGILNIGTLQVGMGWDTTFPHAEHYDFNTFAFLLSDTGKVGGEADVIFDNNPASCGGAVCYNGAGGGDNAVLSITLDHIPPTIQRIVLVVVIHNAQARCQDFGRVPGPYVRLVNGLNPTETIKYSLADTAISGTAICFGELSRYAQQWRFTPSGQGWAGGLSAVAVQYGVSA